MPHPHEAFVEHCKRANYQAAIRLKSLENTPEISSALGRG